MTRVWSVEELDTLDQMWGSRSCATIAQQLGRTPIAVMRMGRKLYGSPLKQTENVHLREFSRAIGVDRNIILNWWVNRYGLPVHRRVLLHKRKYTMINIDEFWKWAEEYRDKIDTRRFEKNALGAEPSWMVEKRRLDANVKRKWDPWTKFEEAELQRLLVSSDLTLPQIAERLGRTHRALNAKLTRLRKRQRARRYSS